MRSLGMRVRFNKDERVRIEIGDHAGMYGRVAPSPDGTKYNWKKEVFIQLESGETIKKFKNEVCKT
ncbi:hypothetical protein P4V86_03660 [Brevibacillus laterosporus]|uniref:hypothetical protein n=1 Tax=Brevibacillus laterosporus TaxID=1465 RepID=UPI00035F0642|nr:hypothetical protein [Brevibacillus laterosporus]ATO48613.1 hypothetical protein BrL25_05470 [Brevibacillus laterosporus DSM 25]MED2002455.1 hypothetical protein [Brevibacillus laterosporus]